LGIPPTLTGTFGAAGTTNNFISLKTLVKRLEYGRGILLDFWNAELKKVQESMGFKLPATIEFDNESLGDEVAEKNLLLQLSDRNLISDELLQRRYGSDPVMEQVRLDRENRQRQAGTRPPKSNPYNNPQQGNDLQKIGLQGGQLTPGEVGLSEDSDRPAYKIEPRRPGEKTNTEMQGEIQQKKMSGQPGQGRPKNTQDKTKRKEKTFKPKIKAAIEIWARDAQDKIGKTVTPLFLQHLKKKNLRALSHSEVDDLELLKFNVLTNLQCGSLINDGDILTSLNIGNSPENTRKVYNEMKAQVLQELNRGLTLDETKHLQACVIAEIN
jgi:hypothetical protein